MYVYWVGGGGGCDAAHRRGTAVVLDVVLDPAVRYRRWRQAGLAVTMILLVVFAGLRLGQGRLPEAAVARTAAPVEVRVTACPVPAGEYAGTGHLPRAAPATLSVPASLAPPANAQIFGTWFLPGQVAYLLGPKSATCQAGLGAADGGEGMAATPLSDRSAIVTMVVKAGGLGPSMDLACPYIPVVRADDAAFRLGEEPEGPTFCAHPSADVIRQIPTGTASLYAAAVYVPPGVTDPNIAGSGGLQIFQTQDRNFVARHKKFLVGIVVGKHPFPFRIRKLSLQRR